MTTKTVDTANWLRTSEIKEVGGPSPFQLILSVDPGDGKPKIDISPRMATDDRASLEILARAWDSGKIGLVAEHHESERGLTVGIHNDWHLPHPKYGFSAGVFLMAVRTGILSEEELRVARETKVEVRNSKHAIGRDGVMWSCTVYVNGKAAADISNDGNGGEDYQRIRNEELYVLGSRHAAVLQYEMPPDPKYPEFRSYDLSSLAAKLCDDADMKKQLTKKVVFELPGGRTLSQTGKLTVAVRAQILKKYPDAIILNETIGGQTAVEMLPEDAEPAYYKRMCKTKTVLRTEPGAGEIRVFAATFSAAVKAQALAKYPKAVFFNETIAGQRV